MSRYQPQSTLKRWPCPAGRRGGAGVAPAGFPPGSPRRAPPAGTIRAAPRLVLKVRPQPRPGGPLMRKWMLAAAPAAALGVAALALAPTLLRARPADGQPDEPPARATQLPIGQVVLFSSGVGYLDRKSTRLNSSHLGI